MKFLLAVFLCGVASCLALPRCSNQDLMECMKDLQNPDLKTLEDLDDYCRGMECITEFYGRCNETAVARNYRYMYSVLCPDNIEIREEIVEKSQCFSDAQNTFKDECDFHTVNKDNDEVCRMIRQKLPCAVRVIERDCNKFMADIFEKVFPKSRICDEE